MVLVSGWQQGTPVPDTRINDRLREPKDDTTFGFFQVAESFNADQVPMNFVSGQTQTSDRPRAQHIQVRGSVRLWRSGSALWSPSSGRAERRYELAIIFRGSGKKMSAVESAAYNQRVHAYFHSNDRGHSLF